MYIRAKLELEKLLNMGLLGLSAFGEKDQFWRRYTNLMFLDGLSETISLPTRR